VHLRWRPRAHEIFTELHPFMNYPHEVKVVLRRAWGFFFAQSPGSAERSLRILL
jgi:hypothetical protein